jgi:hypothetical protein
LAGIFITRGMGLRIPKGGFTIGVGPDGEVNSSVRFEVLLDMGPYWYEVGLSHLVAAKAARYDLSDAIERQADEAKSMALEREFTAGMQVVVASATALDALYASVRDRAGIPDSLVQKWREKRTARPSQVAEVFRRSFAVKGAGFRNLTRVLREIYRFRDLAVHPPSKFSEPILHPILDTGTEWRFVSFGFESAFNALRGSLAVAVQLANVPRAKDLAFRDYCAGLSDRLKPITEQWTAHFGKLVDKVPDATSDGAKAV